MKKNLFRLFQGIGFLIALAILVFLIRMPQLEGRAQHLDLLAIYSDPFIWYGYGIAGLFFAAYYQGIGLLGLIGENQLYSKSGIKLLVRLRNWTIAFGFSVLFAGIFIYTFHAQEDDPAGFLALCLIAVLASTIVIGVSLKMKKRIRLQYE
ncbi:MAG: DUF2975 domain-containing protein [Bacteroidia bacterium]|nr:DUF2975 domain-containing protein [Bacteroidia bacterium]